MKNLPWLLLITISSLVLFLFWLIAQPSGANWLVKNVSDKIDGLEISEFNGRLLDSLNMESLHYEKNGVIVDINKMAFDYSLDNLASKKIVVKQLHIDKLFIELPDSKAAESPTTLQLPTFESPVDVNIQSLNISELVIVSAGKTTRVNDVYLVTGINGSVLQVDKLLATVNEQQIDVNTTVAFKDDVPIDVNAEIKSIDRKSKVKLSIDGSANDYIFKSSASISRKSIPPVVAELDGKGSMQHVEIIKSDVLTLGGKINLTGKLDWHDGLNLDIDYRGSEIDPGVFDQRYSGKINFSGSTKTKGESFQTDLQADGKLRGYPLEIDTQLLSIGDATKINSGKIIVGSNILNVNGGITSKGLSDFLFELNAPGLSQLSPELSGTLTGDGSADGNWEQLKLKAVLIGTSLGFSENTMDGLSVEVNPTENAYEYEIKAKAIGVDAAKTKFEKVQLNAIASSKHQQARFDIHGGPSGLKASGGVEGDYQNNRWNGVIRGFKLTADTLPVYVQSEPAALLLSRDNKSLKPLCLKNRKEEFCIEGEQKSLSDTSISMNLSRFPLKRLAPWVPVAGSFSDSFNGQIDVTGKNNTWRIQAKTSLDQENNIQALVDYESGSKAVVGTIQAKFDKLNWLNLLTDQVITDGGTLVANLDLSGSATKPNLIGNIDLEEMNMRLPETGIEYQNVEMHALLNADQTAEIKGSAISEGELTFHGIIDWKKLPDWMLDLNVGGKRVKVMHLPVGNVSITPALNVIARADGVTIDGKINIPEAHINLGDLPESAVKPSKDEIIIGEVLEDKQTGYPVASNIQLQFGEEVHLSGHGLETRLEGDLQISQKPNEPVRGDGTLKLLEGTYKAYGQDLAIERGEIYFNGPLEPYLNIRATRTIEAANVVAGLQLAGTLEQPESNIFATPTMSESDALSYLLTGKPLGGAGEGDSNLLMNAAIGLGIKGSAGVIEDIRSETGLDTVEINAGQDSTQTYLALGKYLSPRFYIQYATKLFNDSQVFSMRYQLTNKLFLEAETGDDEEAVDLMYQFER